MAPLNQKGKYGRYIHNFLTITDLVLVNLIFFVLCIINPTATGDHTRLVWLVLNVAYIPVAYWFSNVHRMRAIHMDHVFGGALEAVGIHALFFLSIIAFLNIEEIPTTFYLGFYGISIVALPVWWIVARVILKSFRRRGRNFRRVAIVGTNRTAQRLYEEMQTDAGYGFRVMGFFDDEMKPDFPAPLYTGTLDMLNDYVRENAIDEIYFTMSGEKKDALRTTIHIADNNALQFYYVPQISRYINRRFDLYTVGGIPMLTVRHNPHTRAINRFAKRTFDVVFSSIVLLCSPIIFIPVAIAIKISSPGPVFFKQKRTGYRGKDFYCYKFRTMRVNKDADKVQASKNDSRKTRVGDFLRRTSIDELPQFINVFLGSMSVVGPRPHMLMHTETYRDLISHYMVRHLIKPGITGWAQVNGYRGQTEELWQMERRVEYDVWYIENWTWILDLKIIARTVLNAIHGEENAF